MKITFESFKIIVELMLKYKNNINDIHTLLNKITDGRTILTFDDPRISW